MGRAGRWRGLWGAVMMDTVGEGVDLECTIVVKYGEVRYGLLIRSKSLLPIHIPAKRRLTRLCLGTFDSAPDDSRSWKTAQETAL